MVKLCQGSLTEQKENTVWFDNVVVAKDYVGSIAAAP
jgi:hypothetical protein